MPSRAGWRGSLFRPSPPSYAIRSGAGSRAQGLFGKSRTCGVPGRRLSAFIGVGPHQPYAPLTDVEAKIKAVPLAAGYTFRLFGKLSEQRLYQLIRQSGPIADRQFELEFLDSGVESVGVHIRLMQRCSVHLDKIAVSDPATLGGLTQFSG